MLKWPNLTLTLRHELVPEFYRTVSPKLITRFKEREENVKSDIFHAYSALLKQSRPSPGSPSSGHGQALDAAEMMDMDEGAAAAGTPVAMLVGQVSVPYLLQQYTVSIGFYN